MNISFIEQDLHDLGDYDMHFINSIHTLKINFIKQNKL